MSAASEREKRIKRKGNFKLGASRWWVSGNSLCYSCNFSVKSVITEGKKKEKKEREKCIIPVLEGTSWHVVLVAGFQRG